MTLQWSKVLEIQCEVTKSFIRRNSKNFNVVVSANTANLWTAFSWIHKARFRSDDTPCRRKVAQRRATAIVGYTVSSERNFEMYAFYVYAQERYTTHSKSTILTKTLLYPNAIKAAGQLPPLPIVRCKRGNAFVRTLSTNWYSQNYRPLSRSSKL